MFPSSKLLALEILAEIGQYVSDEYMLDRIVPFIVTLLSDEAPCVRAVAMQKLTDLVGSEGLL
jgi:hypothetical protein